MSKDHKGIQGRTHMMVGLQEPPMTCLPSVRGRLVVAQKLLQNAKRWRCQSESSKGDALGTTHMKLLVDVRLAT